MEMRFLLAADAANISKEGKLNITGEFNTIYGAEVPISWPSMVIVARIEAHVGEGPDHAAQFRLADEDGVKIFESPPIPVKVISSGRGIPARGNIMMHLVGLTFPRHGDYTMHLLIDGVSRGHMTLFIRETAPQQHPTQRPFEK